MRTLLNKLPPSLFRWVLNSWPPLRGAGIKVIAIAPNFKSFDVILKNTWLNLNYVGTHFGGSIFSMADPFYMVILLKNLGTNYIIWDKSATIEFIKPGKGTLNAHFEFTDEELQSIREHTDLENKYVFTKAATIYNQDREIVATVSKTIYVRKKI